MSEAKKWTTRGARHVAETPDLCAIIFRGARYWRDWRATIWGNDPERNQGQVIAMSGHATLRDAKAWAEEKLAEEPRR